jgi:CheY-like chemotaxis protein
MKSQTFEIQDTGIGMTEEQLSIIFNEFEQAEISTSRKFGGTGLGLSITKKLVEILKGTINVESSVDKGTTFQIKLQFLKGNEEDVYVIREQDSEKVGLSDLSILVVDDEPYNRKLLCSILNRYSAAITEVENGQEAVVEATRNRYDVVLMDTRMPLMDGIEAAKIIRGSAIEYTSNVPIISISAATSEEDQTRYKKVGMNGFISKPFKESNLIREIIRVTNTTSIDSTALKYPSDSKVKEGIMDFEELAALCAGDHLFFIDMLETFVRSMNEGLIGLKKGIVRKDMEMIADYAHKMSSPCKHISATKLYGLLKELERSVLSEKVEISLITKSVALVELEVISISEVAKEKLAKKE